MLKRKRRKVSRAGWAIRYKAGVVVVRIHHIVGIVVVVVPQVVRVEPGVGLRLVQLGDDPPRAHRDHMSQQIEAPAVVPEELHQELRQGLPIRRCIVLTTTTMRTMTTTR